MPDTAGMVTEPPEWSKVANKGQNTWNLYNDGTPLCNGEPVLFQTNLTMGKHFGQLAYVRGIIKYTLSPFEQRAFAGMISKGLPNVFRRTLESSIYVAPPFTIAYLVFDTVEKKHAQLMRKNPEDYVNDV